MSYGTVWLENGSSTEVYSAQDWAWIEIARERGQKYVVSCADRFDMPAQYFCAYAADEAELAQVKADVSGEMSEVLAVYWVGSERPPVRPKRRRLSDVVRRLINPSR